MDKLSNPFKDGAIRITQTTHNNLGGHSDFTLVRAIDCNAEPYSTNIYAEGDGVVIASVNSSNPNSYLHIHYDGLPGHIIRELVHCRPSVAKGVRVKRGQLVGTLEPYRANWYGTGKHHAVHLHWSFLNTNKTGAPNPFNYLNRTTRVTSNASVILNSRTWFNADGTFNWSSFGDYKLELAPPPPPVDPCAVEKNQIGALQVQITTFQSVNDKLTKANADFKNIEDDYLKQIKVMGERIDIITQQHQTALGEIDKLNGVVAELEITIKKLKAEMQQKDEQILNLKEKNALDLNTLTLGDFIQWVGIKLRGGSN